MKFSHKETWVFRKGRLRDQHKTLRTTKHQADGKKEYNKIDPNNRDRQHHIIFT